MNSYIEVLIIVLNKTKPPFMPTDDININKQSTAWSSHQSDTVSKYLWYYDSIGPVLKRMQTGLSQLFQRNPVDSNSIPFPRKHPIIRASSWDRSRNRAQPEHQLQLGYVFGCTAYLCRRTSSTKQNKCSVINSFHWNLLWLLNMLCR